MSLIIDGYNLLHVTGIVGRGIGPATLDRARGALLNFLAASLDENERANTVIVFDGKDAPPGLPKFVSHQGLAVRYAPRDREADDVIEDLIAADNSPKRLTVVSSDHRVQRAAKRRKATALDSHVWYGDLVRRRSSPETATPSAKPAGPLGQAEVERWLEEFGDVSVERLWRELSDAENRAKAADSSGSDAGPSPDSADDSTSTPPSQAEKSKAGKQKTRRRSSGGAGNKPRPRIENPFPPGYGEDLLREMTERGETVGPFPPGYGDDLLENEDPEEPE